MVLTALVFIATHSKRNILVMIRSLYKFTNIQHYGSKALRRLYMPISLTTYRDVE